MTSTFVTAAEVMARALGAEGYPLVVIDHPLSSATPETLVRWARRAAAAAAQCLIGGTA